ncbi:NADH dehydrogenase [ubiquinone] 1 alpha subcomplex subunit 11 [Cynoglossus semilaevis]|nr:NADH dehydrogenase [ubiquinone] 1 alpha subcomplex subunit 11 [Cynoglossus semilaevis]
MGFFDFPEGTDCVQKLWLYTKLSTAAGLVTSSYHLVFSATDSTLTALKKTGPLTLTIASMGAIFGVTTCLSAQTLKNPEDPLNYFLGGCASGIILGARTRSAATGAKACLALGGLGYISQMAKNEKWNILQPPKHGRM